MLMSIKATSEANSAEQKRLAERKRNILVLINQYLIEHGYFEAAERLQHESRGVLSQFVAADNIDLSLILNEYEAYYEMRFDKKPKLARKLMDGEDSSKSSKLSKSVDTNKRSNSTSNSSNINKENANSNKLPSVVGATSNSTTTSDNVTNNESSDLSFGVSGSSIGLATDNKAKKLIDDTIKFEERLLKPPPQYSNDSDLKPLANVICREIYQDSPNVRFQDIIQLDEAKRLLIEAVQLPLRFPYLFTGILRPWRGILLHGPPGTGKTLLAKAVATECSTTFFNISASTLVSKWRGDSEKLVRVLFEVARYHGPSTIFLDEIDSILTSRNGEGGEHEASRRMKTELLIQMDGVKSSTSTISHISNSSNSCTGYDQQQQVFVMAASNLPWDLDIAVLRRLEKRVLVPLPSLGARKLMFEKHLHDRIPLVIGDKEHNNNNNITTTTTTNYNNNGYLFGFDSVAELTEGYSGADIELVCRESAMMPVRRLMKRLDAITLLPDPPTYTHNHHNNSNTTSSSTRIRKGISTIPGNGSTSSSSMILHENIESFLKADPVTLEDIMLALQTTKPSSDGKISKYEAWQKDYGSV